MNIQKEHDIEILRQAATLLESENSKLIRRTIELERKLLELQGRDPLELQLLLSLLEQELQKKNKALFGPTSEKQSQAKAPETKTPPKGHGPREHAKLPFEVVVHKLDEADKPCPKCGDVMGEWKNQFLESEEVEVEHKHFFVQHHAAEIQMRVRAYRDGARAGEANFRRGWRLFVIDRNVFVPEQSQSAGDHGLGKRPLSGLSLRFQQSAVVSRPRR